MAEEKMQMLKSILKKSGTLQPGRDSSERAKADQRAVAVQHAKIIQHRKDIEQEILESIITLSNFPAVRTPEHSAATPTPSDIVAFKSGIRLFQPSDYDALVEERNVNSLCGYALCPNPKPKQSRGGEWKITRGGFAQRKELERWCSQKCARRALYVKVQLNETAAWERAGIPNIEIELMNENDIAEQVAGESGSIVAQGGGKAAADSAALALERGSVTRTAPSSSQLVEVTILDKDVAAPAGDASFAGEPPDAEADEDYLMLEGHKATFGAGKSTQLATKSEEP